MAASEAGKQAAENIMVMTVVMMVTDQEKDVAHLAVMIENVAQTVAEIAVIVALESKIVEVVDVGAA